MGLEKMTKAVKKPLYLHRPKTKSELSGVYKHAFETATKLYVVTAYLTEWDEELVLNKACKTFRLVVGKDFGITRKFACRKVRKWLPEEHQQSFWVANKIDGFHPKAVFWKDQDDKYYSIIGSSNLTRAAFETNYEANSFGPIKEEQFEEAVGWIKEILERSIIVSTTWLKTYKEAERKRRPGAKGKVSGKVAKSVKPPRPAGVDAIVENRRHVRKNYQKIERKFEALFANCAKGKIDDPEFYKALDDYWHWNNDIKTDTRVQGKGWIRTGKNSNFQILSDHFLRIVNAGDDDERDDLVIEAIDDMKEKGVSTRGSFFSEMLCLRFPKLYPIYNDPMKLYVKDKELKGERGLTQGEKYVDLALKLRTIVKQNKRHPAKNLLEFDGAVYLQYDGS